MGTVDNERAVSILRAAMKRKAMHCLECEQRIYLRADRVWRHASGWSRCDPNRNDRYATPVA